MRDKKSRKSGAKATRAKISELFSRSGVFAKRLQKAFRTIQRLGEVRSTQIARVFGFKGEDARERSRRILRHLVEVRLVKERRDPERKGAFLWELRK